MGVCILYQSDRLFYRKADWKVRKGKTNDGGRSTATCLLTGCYVSVTVATVATRDCFDLGPATSRKPAILCLTVSVQDDELYACANISRRTRRSGKSDSIVEPVHWQ